MSISAEDAQSVFWLFNYGVMSGADVIKWAEDQIAITELPSDPLLELTWTKPDNTAEIISQMNTLKNGADFPEAFRRVLSCLHDYIAAHPADAERIADRLLNTLAGVPIDEKTREFHFLYRCSDYFEHAQQGRDIERSAVLKDFLSELQKFSR
jgi:hypothetical protein